MVLVYNTSILCGKYLSEHCWHLLDFKENLKTKYKYDIITKRRLLGLFTNEILLTLLRKRELIK